MAEKASWTDLLADLMRSFLLLRDVFGYLLPGAIFLLIGIQSGHFPSAERVYTALGGQSHEWIAAILFLIVAYATGHVLAVIVYLPWDVAQLIEKGEARRKQKEKLKGKKESEEEKEEREDKEREEKKEARAALLFYRKKFPDIFVELDRQSILALFRKVLAGSLFLAFLVFYGCLCFDGSLRIALALAGLIMLFHTYTAAHLEDLKEDTLRAAQKAEKEEKERERLPQPKRKKPA